VRTRIRYLRRDSLPILESEAQEALRAAVLDHGLHTEAKAFALWLEARRGALALATIRPLLDDLHRRLEEVSTCSTLVALMLIDTLMLSGHAAPARELTEEIIAFATARNETVYLPELLRMRGEQLELTDPASAMRAYREAIDRARSAGARSFEQRATESLAVLEAAATTPSSPSRSV
jgi:hypothetical protein